MLIDAVILTVALIFLVYSSCSISAGVYLRSLCRNKNAADSVALTFDDGPDPVTTSKVLDVLNEYNAKATFFVIGDKAAQHPEIIKRIVAEGHSLGGHSYHHQWYFPLKSPRSMYNEITKCRTELERCVGRNIPLFRPPFGVTNPMVAKAVKRAGVVSVGWSIRSFDTLGRETNTVKKRVTDRLAAGKVILLHDDRVGADTLLKEILDELNTIKLRSVTINELFNI